MSNISINQIITATKSRLRLMGTSEYDPELRAIINRTAKQLIAKDHFVVKCKTAEIEYCATGNKAPVEDNLISFNFINEDGEDDVSCVCAGQGINGCSCQCPLYFTFIPAVYALIIAQGCTAWYGNNWFTLNGGYIEMPSTVNAWGIKYYYNGLNTEDGLMVFREDQERGLSAQAAYTFAIQYPERFTPMQINAWNNEWLAQHAYLSSQKTISDWRNDRDLLRGVLNSVIYNPRPMMNG